MRKWLISWTLVLVMALCVCVLAQERQGKLAVQPWNPHASVSPGTKAVFLMWHLPVPIDDEPASIKGYYVYRRKKDEKEFTRLAFVPQWDQEGRLLAGSFKDDSTEFDTSYVYAITALVPDAEPPESIMSPFARIHTPADIHVPSDLVFFLGSASPELAVFRVYRKPQGRWLGTKFCATKVGEEIGKNYSGFMIEHGKRQHIQVDFRTGCFLVDIERLVSVRSIRDGRIVNMPSSRIVYQDAKGDLREKWSSEPDSIEQAWVDAERQTRRDEEAAGEGRHEVRRPR